MSKAIDLFEHYDQQPDELKAIIEKWEKIHEDTPLDYKEMAKFHDEVYAIGYTFDSGLDNEPFGLRPIGVPIEEIYPELAD